MAKKKKESMKTCCTVKKTRLCLKVESERVNYARDGPAESEPTNGRSAHGKVSSLPHNN